MVDLIVTGVLVIILAASVLSLVWGLLCILWEMLP
jgi:hypothetical protein